MCFDEDFMKFDCDEIFCLIDFRLEIIKIFEKCFMVDIIIGIVKCEWSCSWWVIFGDGFDRFGGVIDDLWRRL